MDLQQWWDQFKPVKNHLDQNAGGPFIEVDGDSGGGRMFETFGKEVEHVQAILKSDPGKVWTLLDCDGHQVISSGYHHVNRMGYFVTEVPFEGAAMDIDLEEGEDEVYCVAVDGAEAYDGRMFETLDNANIAVLQLALDDEHDENSTVTVTRYIAEDGERIDETSDEQVSCRMGDVLAQIGQEVFPRNDWLYEAENGDTKLGYDEWLMHQIEPAWHDLNLAPAVVPKL